MRLKRQKQELKKLQKVLKKVLDKNEAMWYNIKVASQTKENRVKRR